MSRKYIVSFGRASGLSNGNIMSASIDSFDTYFVSNATILEIQLAKIGGMGI